MSFHFCTITTFSHLYKTWALIDSVKELQPQSTFHVLVTDSDSARVVVPFNLDHIRIYNPHALKTELSEKVIRKYGGSRDKLRWCLKPAFLNYLLHNGTCTKLIYLDNDIAFFNDFTFLFDHLDDHPVVLTPHRYLNDPDKDQNWLEANFKVGLYNAGFIGVNKNASGVLEWWARCCLYRCEKSPVRGLFDDQKYLDLVPVLEPGTLVLSHKGCNLAEWNRENCKRSALNDKVLIDGVWPVVFIHFNKTTVQCFLDREDELLMPFFEVYQDKLRKYEPGIDIRREGYVMSFTDTIKLRIWKLLNAIN